MNYFALLPTPLSTHCRSKQHKHDLLKERFMGRPQKQEVYADNELDKEDEDSGAAETLDLQRDLDSDDDFTDDWISHVDDYDSSDDVNNW